MKLSCIPHDVEAEILSRLPVKTLMKFRCVCKSWYVLMATPSFITMQYHNNHQPKNNNYDNDLLAMSLGEGFDILITNSTASVECWCFNPERTDVDCLPIGSCNGIVCIFNLNFGDGTHQAAGRDEICLYLWNPALRITKTIHHMNRYNTPSVRNIIRFSYHGGNNYKIVMITVSIGHNDHWAILGTDIYSLENNSWRGVEVVAPPANLLICEHSCTETAYVNGAHHWLAETKAKIHSEREFPGIISFDVSEEIFREIPRPPSCMLEEARLFNYKGSLAIFVAPHFPNHCEFWVMKGCGVAESWTKQCHINVHACWSKGLIRNNLLLLEHADVSSIFDVESGKEILPRLHQY